MNARTISKFLVPVVALVVLATGCQGRTFTYDKGIKQSHVRCLFHGNYVRGGDLPRSVSFDCNFTYSGSGEHPYLMIWLSGCSLRVNATHNSNFTGTRQCLGDGIDTVKLQICQTRNGVLPDDCTGKRTWEFT